MEELINRKNRIIIILSCMVGALSIKYIIAPKMVQLFFLNPVADILVMYAIADIVNLLQYRNQVALNDKMKQSQNNFITSLQNEKKSLFDETVKCLAIERPFVDLVYTRLFSMETFRQNMIVTIMFKVSENDMVEEDMNWQYELINRTHNEITETVRVSTIDRDARVVMNAFKYYRDDNVMQQIPVTRNENLVYNQHNYELKIPPHKRIRVSQDFHLKLGVTANPFYQNMIGFNEPSVNLTIHITKPKGYLFSLEIMGKYELACVQNTTEDFNNVDQEKLEYMYQGAIFPGTGLEYSLEKKVSKRPTKTRRKST